MKLSFSLLAVLSSLVFSTTIFSSKLFAQTPPAEVVIMIDLSASTSASPPINDLEIEKNAAKLLLDFFVNSSNRPRVAIGTFNQNDNIPGSGARILTGGELTTEYGNNSPASGLYAVIDSLNSTSGFTDLEVAINVAQSHLANHGNSAAKFIILISDGIPNRPGNSPDYSDCGACGCLNAYNATNIAATNAELAGTKIFGIHYEGHSPVVFCPNEPLAGLEFMRDQVATTPSYFFDGTGNLSLVFQKLSCAISCDDANPCTIDSCNSVTGLCESTPDTSDSDGDGTFNCVDLCVGPDNLLGTACSTGSGACQRNGLFSCNALNTVACIGNIVNRDACFGCKTTSLTSYKSSFKSQISKQLAVAKILSTRLNKLAGKKATVKAYLKAAKKSQAALTQSLSATLANLPGSITSCTDQTSCVSTYDTALTVANIKNVSSAAKLLNDKLISNIKKHAKTLSKTDKANRTKANQSAQAALALANTVPIVSSTCE